MNDDGTITSAQRKVPDLDAKTALEAIHTVAQDMPTWPASAIQEIKQNKQASASVYDSVMNWLRTTGFRDDRLPTGATWDDYIVEIVYEAAKRV